MNFIVIALFLLEASKCCSGRCSEEGPECYENICLQDGYCRDERPRRTSGDPIIVDMKYEVDNIISVDSDLKVVGIQISQTMTWMDNRVYAKNEDAI